MITFSIIINGQKATYAVPADTKVNEIMEAIRMLYKYPYQLEINGAISKLITK